MIKTRAPLRNISAVAASKTVVIEVPCGPRYHAIILQHGYSAGTNTAAAAATNISEIRVKVNGRVQRTMSGTQLRDMNLLNTTHPGTASQVWYDCTGVPNTAPGVSFPLFFAEPWRADARDRDALAWPTNGWQSFQVEVDVGAASTPTLIATAITDELKVNQQPGIMKWIRQSWNASGTSFDITTIDRRDWVCQISLYPDSGGSNVASKVIFRKDGQVLHEMGTLANLALLAQMGMMPIATGRTGNITDLVFDHDDLLGSAIPMDGARDVVLTVEAGSAMSGTITGIIQRLGPPE
jgi:hypothetical protein